MVNVKPSAPCVTCCAVPSAVTTPVVSGVKPLKVWGRMVCMLPTAPMPSVWNDASV